MSDCQRPLELQPIRLIRPQDFPGKSTGVGCHCLLCDKWHLGQFLTDRSVRNQWLGVVCFSQCGSCWRRNQGIHSTGNEVCVLVVPGIFLFPNEAPAEQSSKHNSHTNSHAPTPILNLESPKDEKTHFHRFFFRNFFSSHNCHSQLV